MLETYGQMFIKDDFFLATVNSLGAATNCLSRVLWGLVVDKVLALIHNAQQCVTVIRNIFFRPATKCQWL